MYAIQDFFDAMRNRYVIAFIGADGVSYTGLINGVQPEDGSGNCWIITVNTNGISRQVFIRTNHIRPVTYATV